MKKISCGVSGVDKVPHTHKFSELPCDKNLSQAVVSVFGGDFPLRPAQDDAVFKHDILAKSDNVVLTTPTNSGKSLISYLLLFAHAAHGRRVVLIEPLRALAQEKGLELMHIAEVYKSKGGAKVKVSITTGDYRTSDDFLHTKPAKYEGGHIVVATPERLDAISRDPGNEGWLKKIALVCVDEAHMIGDRKRGMTLELLVSYLHSLAKPPRVVLMSATIANAHELAEWLKPCMVVDAVERYPKLEKHVYALGADEKADQILLDEMCEVLKDDGASVLAFVGSKASAEKAASDMVVRLGGSMPKKRDLAVAEKFGVAWYHAGLSAATKQHIYEQVSAGKVRAVFTTTALGMGVNLPATHVFIRDLKVGGGDDSKDLDAGDILQMLGRAGRGDRNGVGVVFAKEGVTATSLAKKLKEEELPHVVSRLALPESNAGYWGTPRKDEEREDAFASQVMGVLSRIGKSTVEQIEDVFTRSFGGRDLVGVEDCLLMLHDKWELVSFNPETSEYGLRRLGEKSNACYFPPRTAARIGNLIRLLLEDGFDSHDNLGYHLSRFTSVDWLIVVCAAAPELKAPMRWKEDLPRMLNSEIESLKVKSHLYNTWIKSEPESMYSAICFDDDQEKNTAVATRNAKRKMYLATWMAIMLCRLSLGEALSRLEDVYGVKIDELQERFRDNAIWMLSGLNSILDTKCFFNCAKRKCEEAKLDELATARSLKSFNWAFDGRKKGKDPETGKVLDAIPPQSSLIWELIEDLKYRTDLGKLVYGCRVKFPKADRHPGDAAVRKLSENGVTALKHLVGKTVADLESYGIEKVYAEQIVSYIKSRLA